MPLARPANRDAGEWAVIHALRARGCFVEQVDAYGLPDLIVIPRSGPHAGQLFMLEVKDPPGPRGGTSRDGQKLNEKQAAFFAAAVTHGCKTVAVVHTADEALAKVGLA